MKKYHMIIISRYGLMIITFVVNNKVYEYRIYGFRKQHVSPALVMGAMTMSLVANLAALSNKITLPALFLSILIDTGIVISCIAGSIAH